MISKKPVYAYIEHPVIAAVVNSLFSFKEKNKAQERLDDIESQFVLSKKLAEESEDASPVALWIKNYDVTKDEAKAGALGNFAIFYIDERKKGTYTIRAKKVVQAAKFHPQRKRVKHSHPDWGYPILRGVKKGKEYPSVEAAWDDLQRLHEEFPDATIPAPNKLFIMIYGKTDTGKSGVNRFALEIKTADGGGYYIECKDNNKKQTDARIQPAKAEPVQVVGKFSQAEALRKNKKVTKVQIKKATENKSDQ